jgi:hypothetical protein
LNILILLLIGSSRHITSTGAIEFICRHKLKYFIFLGNPALVFIFLIGLNSNSYAEMKYRYDRSQYYPNRCGWDIPASSYVYDTYEEAKTDICKEVLALPNVYNMDYCSMTSQFARFDLIDCGGPNTAVQLWTTYAICQDPTPYVHPDGACSATPYQQPTPITQSVKNYGSGAECPSPYVID